jgi:hypothetical protein
MKFARRDTSPLAVLVGISRHPVAALDPGIDVEVPRGVKLECSAAIRSCYKDLLVPEVSCFPNHGSPSKRSRVTLGCRRTRSIGGLRLNGFLPAR